jgi:hypothetical protein
MKDLFLTNQWYSLSSSLVLLLGLSAPCSGLEVGKWSTGGVLGAWADFAIPAFESERLFQLSCVENVDEDLIEYLVHVDDRVSPITFSEGGTILVEARAPRVQQYTNGELSRDLCTVTLFPEDHNVPIRFDFETRHAVPEQVLMLNPDKQRRFKIDFIFPNLPDFPGCDTLTLRPMVNGRVVSTPDQKPLDIKMGTSFWGFGHSVAVTTAAVDGNSCPINLPIRGTIAINPL